MPTKIIVTHQKAAQKKHGTGWKKIDAAIDKLIDADAKAGITTTFVALDAASFGTDRAKTSDQASFKRAIDHAFGLHRKPDYILILGGPDLVPHQDLTNPIKGKDSVDDPVVPSDLPYACDAPASKRVADFVGPSRVVGRLPDLPGETNSALLITQLTNAATWKAKKSASSKYFGLSTDTWKKSTTLSLKRLFGGTGKAHVSPDEGPAWVKSQLQPDWHFINCHGAQADPQFYGEDDEGYPVAHHSPVLAKKITTGTVVAAECCYGAELFDPSLATAPGICVSYLAAGAIGFVGSTTIAYGPAESNGYADLICRFFLDAARRGASLGSALLEARLKFVKEAAPLSSVDLKTLAQFHLLGDPSIRAVAGKTTGAKSSKKAAAKAFAAHTARRRRLESDAKVLVHGADVAEPDPTQSTPPKMRAALEAAAAAAGYKPAEAPKPYCVRDASDSVARRALIGETRARGVQFHVMTAEPTRSARKSAKKRRARKRAANAAPAEAVTKRLLLLGHEVAGKLVKVERLYAHQTRVVRRSRRPATRRTRLKE